MNNVINDDDWLQITRAAEGTISGTSDEWPALVAAIVRITGRPLGMRMSSDWLRGFCRAVLDLHNLTKIESQTTISVTLLTNGELTVTSSGYGVLEELGEEVGNELEKRFKEAVNQLSRTEHS